MSHLSLPCTCGRTDYDDEPEIEPGDPEDIGPDAPQVTPPTDSEDAKEA